MGITAPEPVTGKHDLTGFDCGDLTLNEWLLRRAKKNQISGTSRTFVVCNDNAVIGFYSLAVGSVSRIETNAKVSKNMPEPIPVMVLARLAVDTTWQNKQIGNGLLKDAILRTIIVSDVVSGRAGIRALLVHALSEKAREFYKLRGFYSSPANDMSLMITLDEARNLL